MDKYHILENHIVKSVVKDQIDKIASHEGNNTSRNDIIILDIFLYIKNILQKFSNNFYYIIEINKKYHSLHRIQKKQFQK